PHRFTGLSNIPIKQPRRQLHLNPVHNHPSKVRRMPHRAPLLSHTSVFKCIYGFTKLRKHSCLASNRIYSCASTNVHTKWFRAAFDSSNRLDFDTHYRSCTLLNANPRDTIITDVADFIFRKSLSADNIVFAIPKTNITEIHKKNSNIHALKTKL
ncbi:hypothetical protein FGIG_11529, partial [Fasciola gigantica]